MSTPRRATIAVLVLTTLTGAVPLWVQCDGFQKSLDQERQRQKNLGTVFDEDRERDAPVGHCINQLVAGQVSFAEAVEVKVEALDQTPGAWGSVAAHFPGRGKREHAAHKVFAEAIDRAGLPFFASEALRVRLLAGFRELVGPGVEPAW